MRALPALLLATGAAAEPLFPTSVASNDLDVIRPDDPSVAACLAYAGTMQQEMPGGPTDDLLVDGVHVFEAAYADGATVEVWVHPGVGGEAEAEALAALLVRPIGRLPAIMRLRLSHVVVHEGDRTAFAEHLGRFFVLYDANLLDRLSTDDLDETVFHESVHAALDAEWAHSPLWRRAQADDGGFVTEYAAEWPEMEDLAESALFALALTRRPGRLPADVEAAARAAIPHRLELLSWLLSAPEPAADLPLPEGCIPLGPG